jgi:hypothetical protein
MIHMKEIFVGKIQRIFLAKFLPLCYYISLPIIVRDLWCMNEEWLQWRRITDQKWSQCMGRFVSPLRNSNRSACTFYTVERWLRSKSFYNWLSVSRSVLVSSPPLLDPWPDFKSRPDCHCLFFTWSSHSDEGAGLSFVTNLSLSYFYV